VAHGSREGSEVAMTELRTAALLVLTACAVSPAPDVGPRVEFTCDAVRVCGGFGISRGVPYFTTTAREPAAAAREYRAMLLAGDCVEVVMADAKCWWPGDPPDTAKQAVE
jgi:hypothetical protein